MKHSILTAIDIGTYSIMGVVAKKDYKSGVIEVLAKSEQPCFGMRNGEVIRPHYVTEAIVKLRDDLSKQTGMRIRRALVNVSGGHLFSLNSEGLVSVSRADQKISQDDINRALKAAQTIPLGPNKEIIQTIAREYLVDGEGGIKNPLDLRGMRLEAKVTLIGSFTPVFDNLGNALAEAEIEIISTVPNPLAVSKAVLNKEQKELGSAVIDIGAGTTTLAVFEKGDLVDFIIFPLGSANITNDIAIGLRTEISTAEEIKRQFATLKGSKNSKSRNKGKDNCIKIPEKSLEFSPVFLRDIVESRVNDIFDEAERALRKMSKTQLPSGIVLTGGGSNLPGIVEFAREKFKLPCSQGKLTAIENLSDQQFAVCCGLLLGGFNDDNQETPTSFSGVGEKTGGFFKKLFKIFLP